MRILKVANDDHRIVISRSVIPFPVWQPAGDTWHLQVGEETVVQLIPTDDELGICGKAGAPIWLSIIGDQYPDHGWHGIGFTDLDEAKASLMTWWVHQASRCAFARHGN